MAGNHPDCCRLESESEETRALEPFLKQGALSGIWCAVVKLGGVHSPFDSL